MSLTLRIQTCHHQFTPTASAVSFDASGGTIGRGTDNVLVLEDPDRSISRVQARIDYRNGMYYMTDLGRNPSLINGAALTHDTKVQLQNDDLLTIGAYEIVATITSEMAPVQFAEASSSSLFELPSAALPQSSLDHFEHNELAAAAILHADNDTYVSQHADPLGESLFGIPFGEMPVSPMSIAENQHISPEEEPLPSKFASFDAAPIAIPDDYDPLADFLLPGSSQSTVDKQPAVSLSIDQITAYQTVIEVAMRTVRLAMLDRFNPAQIEGQLTASMNPDEMQSDSNKARMWDQMKLLYQSLSQEDDAEFERLINTHVAAINR